LDQSFEREVEIGLSARFQNMEFEAKRARSDLQTLRKDFGVGIGWIDEGSYRRSCRHYFTQQFQEFRPNLHV
jgi:hypothetical protein